MFDISNVSGGILSAAHPELSQQEEEEKLKCVRGCCCDVMCVVLYSQSSFLLSSSCFTLQTQSHKVAKFSSCFHFRS